MNKQLTSKAKKRARFFRVFLARKSVVISLVVLLLMLLAAILAPLIAPYDPYKQDLLNFIQPMSAKHLLGTDAMGRDVLSRIIFGTRISYAVGFASVAFAGTAGIMLGLVSGVVGGKLDSIIMRVIDAFMSIPMIILALFIGSIMGKGLGNVMLAVGISMIPGYARVTRGQVISLKQMDFVVAGTLSGASGMKNTMSHIFPNVLSPNIVLMTMNLGTAILSEAALSFLGFGINPPTPSWGSMVSDGYNYLKMNPVIAIAPGIFILVIVLCFNIVGDALRDALDPRLRGAL